MFNSSTITNNAVSDNAVSQKNTIITVVEHIISITILDYNTIYHWL